LFDLDTKAAPAVRRIFGEFIAGHGFSAIAEGLTRDGIPSPSAYDPARNPTTAASPGGSSPSALS
jgi:site-specific DNA recombinase